VLVSYFKVIVPVWLDVQSSAEKTNLTQAGVDNPSLTKPCAISSAHKSTRHIAALQQWQCAEIPLGNLNMKPIFVIPLYDTDGAHDIRTRFMVLMIAIRKLHPVFQDVAKYGPTRFPARHKNAATADSCRKGLPVKIKQSEKWTPQVSTVGFFFFFFFFSAPSPARTAVDSPGAPTSESLTLFCTRNHR
jgi:hypothetical protein